jgi:hypothetical protein
MKVSLKMLNLFGSAVLVVLMYGRKYHFISQNGN